MTRFAPALIIVMVASLALWGFAPSNAAAQSPAAQQRPRVIFFPTRQQVEQRTQQKHVPTGQPTGKPRTQPNVQGNGDLQFHGGPVEETPRVFLIFWGSTWNNGSNGITQDGQIVKNYFQDVGNTSFEAILTQYFDANVHIPSTLTLGGTFLDFSNPPTDFSCGGPTVQDSSIQTEVHNAILANGWPTDPNATYFVYTPSNAFVNDGFNNCSEQVFCGYHGFSSSGVPYSAMPYPLNLSTCPPLAVPNGNAAGDSLVSVSSHEQFEAISDPRLNAWFDAAGFEIGDKCAWDFSAGLTHLNNGGTFAVQTEYSNASHSCVNTFATATPHIQTTPTAISLTTTPGNSPGARSVTLSNSGTGPLNWSTGQLPPWVTVSPTSGSLAPGASQPLTLSFTTPSATPQTYSTNLTIVDANADNSPYKLPITVTATTASTTWYFAEGFTGGGFSEFLTLANPNTVTTAVTVTYLLGSGMPIIRNYSISPTSRFTLNVNNEIGNGQNVSMVVNAAQPIIAERPMYFPFTGLTGLTIPGGSDVLGATSLSQNFDFGYLDTTAGHATFLTILNQNSSLMTVTIQYFSAGGGAPITRQHTVAGNSRGTVNVNTEGLAAGSYSALVSLDMPGLVERPLYLQDSATHFTGSADVVGVATPQTNWFFAEGFTASTFSERYILSNPSTTTTAHATVTFFLSSGSPVSVPVTLAPGAQQTVNANAVLGSSNVNNSAHVGADAPILAERFISFKYTGQVGGSGGSSIPGASDVLGAGAPGFLFYFAEGFTGNQFAEYLTLENPSPSNIATVVVTFLPANGAAPTVQQYRINPSSRFTVFTNGVLAGQSFSLVVESSIAIVAERPMYFNFTGGQTGGSDVVGYQPVGTPLPSSSATAYSGSTDANEYALDASTGFQHWNALTGGSLVSAAAVVNGMVYVGSTDDSLYAFRASDGSKVWSVQTGGPIISSPVVVNGVVYFGSEDDKVYALNATTGALVWSFSTGNLVLSSPAVSNGVVYIGSEDGHLYALNASTGASVWSAIAGANTGVGVEAAPVVANGVVYVGSEDMSEYAFNASTGAQLWSFASSGAILWRSLVANGVVYFGSLDGNVYALNAANGTLQWSFQTGGGIDSAPALDNGLLYAGSLDGNLSALNANSGALVWSFQANAGIESSPAVFNGVVFFGADDGQVYALKASDATLYWTFQTGGQVFTDVTLA